MFLFLPINTKLIYVTIDIWNFLWYASHISIVIYVVNGILTQEVAQRQADARKDDPPHERTHDYAGGPCRSPSRLSWPLYPDRSLVFAETRLFSRRTARCCPG